MYSYVLYSEISTLKIQIQNETKSNQQKNLFTALFGRAFSLRKHIDSKKNQMIIFIFHFVRAFVSLFFQLFEVILTKMTLSKNR